MYNATPEVQKAWHNIFDWVAQNSGVELETIDFAAPQPLEGLWSRGDLGAVFMCGWPYAMAKPQPKLIVAPVPLSERHHGKPIYFTDLVVKANSPFEKLEDTFGGRVVWTVDHSNSGFNALRHHLQGYICDDSSHLYNESLGPVISPRAALSHVIDGRADVAPLDSWFHDLLKLYDPETARKIRVIDSTVPSPVPPLVASQNVSDTICKALTDTFLDVQNHPSIQASLDAALVSEFVKMTPADYQITLDRAKASEDAGYEKPS